MFGFSLNLKRLELQELHIGTKSAAHDASSGCRLQVVEEFCSIIACHRGYDWQPPAGLER